MYVPTVLILASCLGLVSASPVLRKSLSPKHIQARSPLVLASFAEDWPTNVVMVGGSQTYGMWVPPDGTWYDLGNIECLGIPAYAIGDCNDVVIDQIGVVAGYGPCRFVGISGYSATIEGAAGEGYYTVGPPQNIMSAACGLS